ncbi:MAG: efflux RND transporter periplasmic adaptor subunit [Phyllobacteriaceae bacterium]|nr:efflux RND transporter periplasmic adaptor subunit [Phyllobacteriaceae bacterium]
MRKSYLWAVGIAGVLSLWMASPYIMSAISGAPHEEATETAGITGGEAVAEKPVKLFRVRTRDFAAQPYMAAVTAQGTTEASAHVDARSRTNGIILTTAVKQGQSVKKGDLLCEIDLGSWETDMLRAEADAVSADRDLAATTKLARQRYATEAQLLSQRARKEAADATIAALKLERQYKKITATTDGVLIQKPAEAGTLMQPGSLCATVSTLDPLLVVVQVGERFVPYLTEGYPASAKLATGEEVKGTVKFIAKASDVATRTFRVELEVPNPGGNLRQGVSAALRAELPPVQAHKLPGSVMSLNDAGEFGVRLVNTDMTTQFTPVMVIEQAADGMWVTGLPATAKIVTVGQDFVKDGEKVEAVVDTADAAQ